MASRYAEATKVPVETSQNAVKSLLRKAGADQLAVYEAADKSSVAFRINGRFYRITSPARPDAKNLEQEDRRNWRLLLLLIKAKLEAVKEGATTIEREFLADTIMPDGSTMAEHAEPALKLAYEKGEMPTRFLLGGPSDAR